MRTWLSSSVLAIALVSALGAQQLTKPPGTKPPGSKPGGPSHTVQFKVSIEPESLVLRRELLEDQSVITHVTMAPASGEPVFYPDEPGFPSLPRLARFVAVPAGAKIQSVTIAPGKTKTIPDVKLVGWASPTQPGQGQKQPGDNPNDPKNRFAILPEFPLDDTKREVYYPSAPAPPDPAVLKLQVYPENMTTQNALQPHSTGISVLRLDVAPVQWHVQKGQLLLTTDLTVNVVFDGNGKFDRPKTPGEGNMYDDLRDLVINPGDLPFWVFDPRPIDVPYLIITDDNYWTSDFERTPGADLVEQFEELAQWKREKGVRATVVRIADIVDGRYGDFRSGALDLQETIRNFLKHAEAHYRTQWVLLGGDIEVVPPRHVSVWGHVNAAHRYKIKSDERPKNGFVYWDSANGRTLINAWATGFTHLISPRTGRTFMHAADPTEAAPGWREVDTTEARAGSRCLELIAPAADIESADVMFALYENTIPTDLYYSSLRGPEYDTPGRHDWDLNNDGLYGTNVWDRSADGVSYWPTLRLGRAPVSNATEAEHFVRKVVRYEQHQMPFGFAGKHLLAADYWGGSPKARRGSENPPPEGRAYHQGDFSIVHFGSAPSPATDWRIVAWRSTDSWQELSYSRDAGPGIDGYYFCTDATCAVRSEIPFPLLFIIVWIPVPTEFVKVEAPHPFEDAPWFFFDHRTLDGAMVEKEQVKSLFTRFFTGLDDRQRLYKDIYDIAPEPDLSELFDIRVTEALRDGVNITSLSGHGWYGGCCGLDFRNVPEMNRFAGGGVVYADSCLTNEFDQAAGDAVSELLLTQPGGGAVAYVGNSRLSWIGLGSSFERSFWRRMRTTRHIGALHNTKAGYTAGPNEQWVNFSLNLMGDPEMEIWRQEPRDMFVSDVAREVFQGSRIRGRVLDSSGEGVPLARVTLTGPGVYQVDFTDGSGNFEFTPAGRPDDVLKVTATHTLLEYKPDIENVRVIRRVFTLEPPPGLPPSWPPGLPPRP
jgi:hypothetical protein